MFDPIILAYLKGILYCLGYCIAILHFYKIEPEINVILLYSTASSWYITLSSNQCLFNQSRVFDTCAVEIQSKIIIKGKTMEIRVLCNSQELYSVWWSKMLVKMKWNDLKLENSRWLCECSIVSTGSYRVRIQASSDIINQKQSNYCEPVKTAVKNQWTELIEELSEWKQIIILR